MQDSNFNNTIYTATKWSAITNVLRKLITPITNMVLARILTPDAFGVVATINMVISFADLFTDAGFQKYLVQHEFDGENQLYESADVCFWTNFAFSIFLWVLISIFRNPIVDMVGSKGYGLHLVVASLTIPLLSFSSIQQAIFRRNFDFKSMFIPRIVNTMVPLVVTIPLAYFTRNCWALIIGTLVSNLSDAVLLTVKSKWKPKLYYSIERLKEMLSFSIWTMLESLSIWLTINIDIFILGRTISSYNLGLYKTSITSVSQITTLITTTIIPVLFAALSRSQSNKKRFDETFYSFQNKSAMILIPMSVGIFLYSDVVTWILLGNQWMEATKFIGSIGLIQAFTILYANFASEVYRSMGEPKISFIVQIAYILLIIPVVTYGAKKGFDKLCLYRSCLMLVFVVMHVLVLKFRYKMSLQKMLKNISHAGLASLVMAIIGVVLHRSINSMVLKTCSIAVCIVIYFIVCMFFEDTRGMITFGLNKIKKGK